MGKAAPGFPRIRSGFPLVILLVLATVPVLGNAPEVSAATRPGPIVSLATGFNHSCVTTNGQGVQCWGRNDSGEVGDGSFNTAELSPQDVVGLAGLVVAIDGGGQGHTCAIISGGAVQCWGRNRDGQLGDGTLNDSATPVNVLGLPGSATAITTGGDHVCALIDSGAMYCWGRNDSGQLGDGTFANSSAPRPVVGLDSGVTAIDAGGNHTCAILTGGDLECWGANGFGQVGDGTTVDRSTPVQVVGLSSGVLRVSNGGQASACAVTSTHGVKCWGNNKYGQVGDGTTTHRYTPVDVVGLSSGVNSVGAGGAGQICAVLSSSGVECWGRNDSGQLGDGTTTERHTPVDVIGLGSGVGAVATGGNHTCALMIVRSVKCWGNNVWGAVGDGTQVNRSTPVEVIDPVPPTTTISTTPPGADGHGGSYASSAHVSVTATDDDGGSGVVETRCVLDPAAAPSSFAAMDPSCPLSGAGIDVTSPGAHVVYAASIDAAGNDETPVSFPFRIGHTLSVSVDDGPGEGSSISSTPAGIDCGTSCSTDFSERDVTLTASPGPGLAFAGWSGDCSGLGDCTVTMTQDRSATARFTVPDSTPPATTISRSPETPDGSSGSYAASVHVSVAATDDVTGVAETRCALDPASAPASFGDLPAGCAFGGSGADVTVAGAHVVYAASTDAAGNREPLISSAFRIGHALSVTVNDAAGSGSRVTSSPSGIACSAGVSCTGQFAETNVTLTPTPGAGRTFTGWQGACSGTGTCVVSLTQDASVTATFTQGNLVGNGGFETDTSGWIASGSKVTLGRVSPGRTGNGAAQVSTAARSATCTLDDSPNWVRSTTAGTYTVSMWFRSAVVGTTFTMRIREYVGKSSVRALSVSATTNGSWQQVSTTYVPKTAGSALDVNAIQSAPRGACFSADDVSITKG